MPSAHLQLKSSQLGGTRQPGLRRAIPRHCAFAGLVRQSRLADAELIGHRLTLLRELSRQSLASSREEFLGTRQAIQCSPGCELSHLRSDPSSLSFLANLLY